jgi:hypothetical protein
MTPAKRRPAAPASQGRKRAAPVPKVPTVADPTPVPPAATKDDDAQLLGPDGEPIAQEAAAGDVGADSAHPTETGRVDPEDRATTQSPPRSRALYPLPVWPD